MNRDYQIEWRHPDLLRFYPYNSRVHEPEQVAQIAASLQEFGWTNPILIDDEDMVIAGHGRLMAAREMKMPRVPCLRLSGLDADQRRAYVLADNQLALNASWDLSMLRLELKDLEEIGFDLGLIGFPEDELAEIMKIDGGAEDHDPEEYTLTISSKDEAEIMALRKILGMSKNGVKIKAGDLLSRLAA